jgi:formylmethanofuran dehydrogenase subunit E
MNASFASSNNVADTDNLGVFCAACKPGYKPSFSNIDYHVYNCEAITNCIMTGDKASKKSFNECDHCAETFYHPYTTADGLDKTVCM